MLCSFSGGLLTQYSSQCGLVLSLGNRGGALFPFFMLPFSWTLTVCGKWLTDCPVAARPGERYCVTRYARNALAARCAHSSKREKEKREETGARRRERMRKNILTAAISGFDQAVCGKAPFYEKLPYTRLGGNSCAFAVHAVQRLIP